MAHPLPEYEALMRDLSALQIPVSAAELHGALSGCLCAGAELEASSWLGFVLTDDTQQAPAHSGLAALFAAVSTQLASDGLDFDFDLLLPDESQAVSERGAAMIDWCQGFLGGFGLVPTPRHALSEEAEEALQDVANIANADLNYEDTDADEEALSEVCEYIRVVAVLLYNERVVGRQNRQRLN